MRFPLLQPAYPGLDGAVSAINDGKIWLNDTSTILELCLRFALGDLRSYVFNAASQADLRPVPWPYNDDGFHIPDPNQWYPAYLTRHERRFRFMVTFCGRDPRFGVLPDNHPGGGLEIRLEKVLRSRGVSYAIRSKPWDWPIDPARPQDAPSQFRKMQRWLGTYDKAVEYIAQALIADLVDQPPKTDPMGTLRWMVLDMTAILLGLPNTLLDDFCLPFEEADLLATACGLDKSHVLIAHAQD